MDAGRFERLEKAARQTDADDVALPGPLAAAGREPHRPRIAERRPVQIGEEQLRRLLLTHVRAGIDQAVAGAMLQRNAPLPAGRTGGRARIGGERCRPLRRDGKGAVARQPARPVLVSDAQRFAEQQCAHARTVDEQVTADRPPVGQHHVVDMTIVGSQVGRHDPPLDPRYAAALRMNPEEAREQRRVEMVGVIQPGERRFGIAGVGQAEAVAARGKAVQRIMIEVLRLPAGGIFQPELVRVKPQQILADLAEAVDVAVPRLAPVDELDPQLEGGLGGADHLHLIEPGQRVIVADRRDRRLAHADGSDLVGFDQGDVISAAREQLRQQRGRHPARGPTAYDGNAPNGRVGHSSHPPVNPARCNPRRITGELRITFHTKSSR